MLERCRLLPVRPIYLQTKCSILSFRCPLLSSVARIMLTQTLAQSRCLPGRPGVLSRTGGYPTLGRASKTRVGVSQGPPRGSQHPSDRYQMPTTKLTPAFVKAAAKPCKKRTIFWDETLPCFGLMVTASGHCSYVVQYRSD